MSLDVESLQNELQALRSERITTEERIHLYSSRGRGQGRGRGRGGHPGGGFPGRSLPQGPPADVPDGEAEPSKGLSSSLKDRLGSREGSDRPAYQKKRVDEHDHRYSRQEWNERMFRQRHRDEFEGDALDTTEAEALPGSNTDRLASAVVETTQALQDGANRGSKRALENQNNPAQQKRNKRLFGNLLGTLQKFQEEDQRFKRSKLAQTRAEAEQRAEQRALVETERVRERQKQEIAKARLAEINKKRELDLKFQAKEREVALALRVKQEMKLTQWLKTGTQPPLLWLPKTHNEDTKLLLEQRLTDVTAWRDAQLERLMRDREATEAGFKPLQPRPVDEERKKKAELEGVDTADLQPADPENPITEPTPLPEGMDRYEGEDEEPQVDEAGQPVDEQTGMQED